MVAAPSATANLITQSRKEEDKEIVFSLPLRLRAFAPLRDKNNGTYIQSYP
jgi:hypothetical protein